MSGMFVAGHCVVHLLAAGVQGGVLQIKNLKVSVANSALQALNASSETDHTYLNMQISKMRRTSVNIIGGCVDDLMVVAV